MERITSLTTKKICMVLSVNEIHVTSDSDYYRTGSLRNVAVCSQKFKVCLLMEESGSKERTPESSTTSSEVNSREYVFQ